MSEENVELVEQLVNAWNRGDYDAGRDLVDPDVEVEVALGADYDGTYSGHAGVREAAAILGSLRQFSHRH